MIRLLSIAVLICFLSITKSPDHQIIKFFTVLIRFLSINKSPDHQVLHLTIWLISKIGKRIASTMKNTTDPMNRIMTGSISEVRREITRSTSPS